MKNKMKNEDRKLLDLMKPELEKVIDMVWDKYPAPSVYRGAAKNSGLKLVVEALNELYDKHDYMFKYKITYKEIK